MEVHKRGHFRFPTFTALFLDNESLPAKVALNRLKMGFQRLPRNRNKRFKQLGGDISNFPTERPYYLVMNHSQLKSLPAVSIYAIMGLRTRQLMGG
jgi:hypothetical protein